VGHDVTRKKPRKVASRFELAASRMAEARHEAGTVTVSADDLRVAREFLTQFWGFLQGAPYPIDTTAGGVAPTGTSRWP